MASLITVWLVWSAFIISTGVSGFIVPVVQQRQQRQRRQTLLTQNSRTLPFSLTRRGATIPTDNTSSPRKPANIESNESKHQPPETPQAQTHAAIVLNTNARSVSTKLCDMAEAVFGARHVFVTGTPEQARAAAETIVQRNYSLVIPVGGDGTLSSMIQLLCLAVHDAGANTTTTSTSTTAADNTAATNGNDNDCFWEQGLQKLPVVGYLPLGTGNGVGSVVGCRIPKWRKYKHLRRIMERLRDIGAQEPFLPSKQQQQQLDNTDYDVLDMPMMEVTHHSDDDRTTMERNLCFFAGVGFDSLMLDDFKRIKAWSKRTGFLTSMLSSVTGYCVALVVKTLPKCVFRGSHNIRVKLTTQKSGSALWVDHRRGDFVQPIQSKELYTGKTGILAAGTSPFYGGGMRLFPFARLTTDKMHLRLGRIHPLVGFLNIPRIFAGSYRDKSDRFGCLDFIGDDFEVEVASTGETEDSASDVSDGKKKGFPFQHSGESVGHVERFRLRVVKEPVRFISLF